MNRFYLPLAAVVLFALFGWFNHQSPIVPYKATTYSVAVPLPLQIATAGGDRHLAANINAFRVVTIGGTRPDPTTAEVLGRIQHDTAWLNPAHEDNYYVAAAVLSWVGQVDNAQYVLRRAAFARTNDIWPAFYFGFNRYYFYGDYRGAAEALALAATKTDRPGEKNALLDMAGKWSERIVDPELAKHALTTLMGQSSDRGLKKYLSDRMRRVDIVRDLRVLAERFKAEQGRNIRSVDELVQFGYLKEIPPDPLEQGGYVVVDGWVIPEQAAK